MIEGVTVWRRLSANRQQPRAEYLTTAYSNSFAFGQRSPLIVGERHTGDPHH
jgi:hypothetical protein